MSFDDDMNDAEMLALLMTNAEARSYARGLISGMQEAFKCLLGEGSTVPGYEGEVPDEMREWIKERIEITDELISGKVEPPNER